MSDKKGHIESDISLLRKKSARKKKAIPHLEKNFDMKKFRDKIFNQITTEISKPSDIAENYDYTSDYEKKYKEYLQEGHSYITLMFVNRIIIDSPSLPQTIRTNFALHKILFGIVKTLMMNELEIVYLSLYLDKMGWTTEGYQLDENLLITGISVKMYLNNNYGYIIEHLSKKMKIEDRFNTWLTIKKDYYNSMTIAPRELNERYKLLSKPFDTYCKQNYIDYNFIVDQILQMSLPYSEGKSVHERVAETPSQEHTYFEPSVQVVRHTEPQVPPQHPIQQIYSLPIKQENLMSSQGPAGVNLFSIPSSLENAYGTQKQSEYLKLNLDNNNNLSMQPQFSNNQLNMNLGRIDSVNNFLRDGSYLWDNNNDRYLPSRGVSQFFAQNTDDGQEETKNLFSKNNAFRNMSVQSFGNDIGQNAYNTIPSPTRKVEGQNSTSLNQQQISLIPKEENEGDGSSFLVSSKNSDKNLKNFSFDQPISSYNTNPVTPNQPQQNAPITKPLTLLVSGTDIGKNLNYFKKLKEEKQNQYNQGEAGIKIVQEETKKQEEKETKKQ